MPPPSPQTQIVAKTITFLLIVGIAFLIGQGSLTGSTVGDFGSTNKTLGGIVLALVASAGLALYFKYRH